MKEKNVKLWTKDFVLIILINFFVFLNHLIIMGLMPMGYLFASTVIMSLLSVIICRMAHGINRQ